MKSSDLRDRAAEAAEAKDKIGRRQRLCSASLRRGTLIALGRLAPVGVDQRRSNKQSGEAMSLNIKSFAVLFGTLAMLGSLVAAPADACGRKHWRGADGGAVYGWHHHHRHHMG